MNSKAHAVCSTVHDLWIFIATPVYFLTFYLYSQFSVTRLCEWHRVAGLNKYQYILRMDQCLPNTLCC